MVEIRCGAEAAKWADVQLKYSQQVVIWLQPTLKKPVMIVAVTMGDNTGGEQSDGPVEVTADMKVRAIGRRRGRKGAPNWKTLSKPGVKKQDIVDAILANRTAANTGE